MGYQTDLFGEFKTSRPLTVKEKSFLEKLANTRRMARNVGEEFGIEGEFYVDGSDGDWGRGQGHDDNVIDRNTPPKTQPGLWLQWVPTEDGMGIEWDGGEKFYYYVEWLQYLIDRVFPHILEEGDEPLVLNGDVEWFGEDADDRGIIRVRDNNVKAYEAQISYPPED